MNHANRELGLTLGFILGFILLIGVVVAVIQGADFFMYRWVAPKAEQTRRKVFEQSKAYNDGMVQDLRQMQFEYVRAPDAQKPALASIILHRAAAYDIAKLPPDLRAFITDLQGARQ